ncbi:MAG: MATE family efflux transporter [Myxococcota bacterium]|nr:MATE family efflux transporter [Myxococcota bacterium]MDW8362243.1 MATE family efflux transporter [Myxococcales bacterium]
MHVDSDELHRATASTWSAETSALLRIGGPLILTYLGNQALAFVAMLVAGRLDAVTVGAVGLGGGIYFGLTSFALGVTLGLDPLVAQAVGAGEHDRARTLLWQGAWLAVLASFPVVLLLVVTGYGVLPFVGLDADVARETGRYLLGRIPGLPAFLLTIVGRRHLAAYGIGRPMIVSVLVANAVNVPASLLLVLGDAGLVAMGLPPAGLPALGALGAALAPSLATVAQAGVVLCATRTVRAGCPVAVRRRPDLLRLVRMARLGLPVSGTLAAEVGAFVLANVLAGLLGPLPLAAHGVAVTLAALTFQVPLALGAAAATRVGHAVGRGDPRAARLAGIVAMLVGGGFMGACGLLLALAPEWLASRIVTSPDLVRAAAPLLLVAAAFQVFDGVQVIAAGALRGAGDLRAPLVANALGYYALGLPLGTGLAFPAGLGVLGVWWGLTTGLGFVAVVLAMRFHLVTRRPLTRLRD